MRFNFAALSLVAAALLAPVAAHADNFAVTTGGDIYTFQIAHSPVVTTQIDGYNFTTSAIITDKTVLSGLVVSFPDAIISFYNGTFGGGVGANDISGNLLFALYGAQFYTGSEAKPTFVDAIYPASTDPNYPLDGTTPDSQVSITPEPSSFLLLGTGVLGLFGAARRRLAQ